MDPKDGWIDLLKKVSPAPGWKKVDNGWESTLGDTTILPLGERPSECYELHSRFRMLSDNEIIVFRLPIGTTHGVVYANHWATEPNNLHHGLGYYDGQQYCTPPTAWILAKFVIREVHEMRYRFEVQGGIAKIVAHLDGEQIWHWIGKSSLLTDNHPTQKVFSWSDK